MRNYKTTRIREIILSTFVLMALIAFSSASAFASTASNAIIRNTVTVAYNDTDGTAQTPETAWAEVTVNLRAATPTLSKPDDRSTDPATAAIYSYTITSNANGPDTYNLSAVITNETGINTSSISILPTPDTILGASTVATAGSILATGTTVIVVPADDAPGGPVNGITAGSTVVINGEIFTVDSVDDDNGGTSGTSTITVNGNGTVTAIAYGDQIGEQGILLLTVTPGTVTTNSPPPTITVVTTIWGSNSVNVTDETITTIDVADLSVVKVADVTSAAPGETITYTITVTNNGNSNATAATVTDPVPQFTSYVASSTRLNGITVVGDGSASPLVGGLLVDDNAGRGAGVAATGIIPHLGVATVTFQVTIDQ